MICDPADLIATPCRNCAIGFVNFCDKLNSPPCFDCFRAVPHCCTTTIAKQRLELSVDNAKGDLKMNTTDDEHKVAQENEVRAANEQIDINKEDPKTAQKNSAEELREMELAAKKPEVQQEEPALNTKKTKDVRSEVIAADTSIVGLESKITRTIETKEKKAEAEANTASKRMPLPLYIIAADAALKKVEQKSGVLTISKPVDIEGTATKAAMLNAKKEAAAKKRKFTEVTTLVLKAPKLVDKIEKMDVADVDALDTKEDEDSHDIPLHGLVSGDLKHTVYPPLVAECKTHLNDKDDKSVQNSNEKNAADDSPIKRLCQKVSERATKELKAQVKRLIERRLMGITMQKLDHWLQPYEELRYLQPVPTRKEGGLAEREAEIVTINSSPEESENEFWQGIRIELPDPVPTTRASLNEAVLKLPEPVPAIKPRLREREKTKVRGSLDKRLEKLASGSPDKTPIFLKDYVDEMKAGSKPGSKGERLTPSPDHRSSFSTKQCKKATIGDTANMHFKVPPDKKSAHSTCTSKAESTRLLPVQPLQEIIQRGQAMPDQPAMKEFKKLSELATDEVASHIRSIMDKTKPTGPRHESQIPRWERSCDDWCNGVDAVIDQYIKETPITIHRLHRIFENAKWTILLVRSFKDSNWYKGALFKDDNTITTFDSSIKTWIETVADDWDPQCHSDGEVAKYENTELPLPQSEIHESTLDHDESDWEKDPWNDESDTSDDNDEDENEESSEDQETEDDSDENDDNEYDEDKKDDHDESDHDGSEKDDSDDDGGNEADSESSDEDTHNISVEIIAVKINKEKPEMGNTPETNKIDDNTESTTDITELLAGSDNEPDKIDTTLSPQHPEDIPGNDQGGLWSDDNKTSEFSSSSGGFSSPEGKGFTKMDPSDAIHKKHEVVTLSDTEPEDHQKPSNIRQQVDISILTRATHREIHNNGSARRPFIPQGAVPPPRRYPSRRGSQ